MAKTKHILKATKRETGKTAVARRLRKTGVIPAVVYGNGKENRNISVDAREWAVLARNDLNLITLIEDGTETLVLLKDTQHDFIRNRTSHIDFYAVDMNKKIETKVPLHAGHNAPKGVAAGGVFDQNIHELEVECLPDDLPEHIEVEVGAMEVGSLIHVREITAPAGVKIITHGDLVAFQVIDPNAIKEDVPVAAAAPEEGADAAAEPELIKKPVKEEAPEEGAKKK